MVCAVFVFAGIFSSCKKNASDNIVLIPSDTIIVTHPDTVVTHPDTVVVIPTGNVAGLWSGTAVNTGENSSFHIDLTLKQTGNDINGAFSMTAAGGSITGSVSGNSVVLTLKPTPSSGYTEVDTFKGTLNAAATEITGTFKSSEYNIKGTFDIKKR